MREGRRHVELRVCALLVLAIAAVYAPVLRAGFVASDDVGYVVANPQVKAGLSAPGLVWAFTTDLLSNWLPLTWLSLMLDVELFGSGPAGFHATNAALHALGTLLTFAALRALTGRTGPSAFAAALHALHPIHVESVAWIPQRKDVLSFAFGAASLWAWAGWARRGGRLRYAASAAWLALGLMAKPTLVTLPLVFLLLDDWPLRRLGGARRLARAALEKAPLLALSLASALVTLAVQQPAMLSSERVGLGLRLANAAVATLRYLGKLVWPEPLAFFYTHPNLPGGTPWTAAQVAAAAALLAALTLGALAFRRAPWLRVGWLWFLVALFPMSGLVQVGGQALADRYAYLPFLGLYVAIAWSGDALLERVRRGRPALAALALAAALAWLAGLGALARAQVGVWRDSEALFENAVRVSPSSPFALTGLALARVEAGRLDEAQALYRRALAVAPDHNEARIGLGATLAAEGRLPEAIEEARQAVAYRPGDAAAHLDLGRLLHAEARLDEAAAAYDRALELAPDLVEAHRLRAKVWIARGDEARAAPHLDVAIARQRELLALDPDSTEAWVRQAELLREAGRGDASRSAAERAVALAPDSPAALDAAAQAWLAPPDPDPRRALELARRATARPDGQTPQGLATLARAEAAAGDPEAALETAARARARAAALGLRGMIQWIEGLERRFAEGAAGEPPRERELPPPVAPLP